jgi:DNA-binding XRE family transcriptional regulator
MAFVRRKKMGGKHYYQLVRNYREGGKHRQEVSCHLGVHDSIEAAIADKQRQVDHHEKEAALREEAAHRIEAKLKHDYGDDVEIIDEHQARYELFRLVHWYYPHYKIPHYAPPSFDQIDRDQMLEDWEIDTKKFELIIAYHIAMRRAEGYRVRAARPRDKLDKLLECQRKYFQQQEQAAERKRDELPEMLTHSADRATQPASEDKYPIHLYYPTAAQKPDRTERQKVNRNRIRHKIDKIDGRQVQFLREAVEWLTLVELAEISGVSQVAISEIERGRRPYPQPEIFLALAKALGVEPGELVARD